MLAKQERDLRSLSADQVKALLPVLKRAREETRQALSKRFAKDMQADWTAAKLATTSKVLDDAYGKLGGQVAERLGNGADVATVTAIRHEEAALKAAGLLETVQPIRVDETALLLEENSLLIERHGRLANGAAKRSVQNLKGLLAVETLKGSTTQEVIDKLTAKGGLMEGQEYDARRLVVTEFYNTKNEMQLRLLRRRKAEGLDPKKRLINPLDSHTAPDTLAIIAFKANLVRELDEPFWDPMHGKFFQRPPNRPNDRAVLAAYYGAPEEEEAIKKAESEAQKLAERFPDNQEALNNPKAPPPSEERPKPTEAEQRPIPSIAPPVREPALERDLQELEREIVDLKHERAIVLGTDGTEIARREGDRNSVLIDLPSDVLKDSIVVHNHPGKGPPSAMDFAFMVRKEVGEVRTVYRPPSGGTGYFSSIISLGAALAEAPVSGRETFLIGLSGKILDRVRELLKDGKLTARYKEMGLRMGLSEAIWMRQRNTHISVLIAREFGLGYETIRRQGDGLSDR